MLRLVMSKQILNDFADVTKPDPKFSNMEQKTSHEFIKRMNSLEISEATENGFPLEFRSPEAIHTVILSNDINQQKLKVAPDKLIQNQPSLSVSFDSNISAG